MKSTVLRSLTGLTLSWVVMASMSSFIGGCAEGSTIGTAPNTGTGAQGGQGGSETTGPGGGGSGGAAAVNLALCVLNEGGLLDPCADPAVLAFGTVAAGTEHMRAFRIDNLSDSDAVFETVSIQDTDYSIQAIRYVEDPPNDPTQWLRAPVTLPSTRPAGESLYFEVTYTSSGVAENLAPMDVVVTAKVGGQSVPNVLVPISGEALGCAAGTATCDADPNNGCDTDTTLSVDHCGGCDNLCAPANAGGVCENGTCKIAICMPGFGNCNAMDSDGCETDTSTTMNHCGSCNSLCDLANASEVCAMGSCLLNQCTAPFDNCDVAVSNGCETNLQTTVEHCGACNKPCVVPNSTPTCVAGVCAIGSCNPSFADCDKNVANGCEVNLGTSVIDCGMCGNVCNFANSTEACTNGTCAIAACDSGWQNCDGMLATGCEKNVTMDVANCGACNNNCSMTMVNANVGCTAGACQLVSCLSGYFDADGMTANGCECQFVGADLPDDNFVDANCDGIDGDASAAIFVAKTGTDANPGTKAQPVFTMAAAFAKALASGKTQIYVSTGTYDGAVSLVNGISIYGGYNAQANWARSAANIVTFQSGTVTNGRVHAVTGKDLNLPMTLDRLTIRTLDTTTAGVSNYAMHCDNCGGVVLRNSALIAGAAGAGSAGTAGTNGAAGQTGTAGSAGACDSSGTRTGGPGGTSSCGRTGGAGGTGGAAGANNGANGSPGVGGTSGGAGGTGGNPGGDGSPGANGTAGAAGTNGSGGSGGSTASGFWVGAAGAAGTAGGHGNGGGGGGGGGGQGGGISISGGGNGGGGGGGGGCGGTNGTGGTAGGGSFGLFVINTSGMQIVNTSIASGKGGNGGAGGARGTGGGGGAAGSGATTCSAEIGTGGNGGIGGAGGNGGFGGGGAGGPSYALYRVNSTITSMGNTLTFNTGGTGGTSGGSAGTNGASGQMF